MNLFDQLVDEALKNNTQLSPLRVVVEKELLHHDILRTLSHAGLLTQLTFIGGTCLRSCYGSNRLSEDLDFTGGADFTREKLVNMSQLLIDNLETKYGLQVKVKEPTRETGNVDTWTLQVQTRPGQKDLPAQRINIDICAIPSYQVRSTLLLNPYGINMGTNGLILHAESREEILADKLVAFALRPYRLKYRDLWDIAWLHQHNISLPIDLIPLKIKDQCRKKDIFLKQFLERQQSLKSNPKLEHEFNHEMTRFLPSDLYVQTNFWGVLTDLMDFYAQRIQRNI